MLSLYNHKKENVLKYIMVFLFFSYALPDEEETYMFKIKYLPKETVKYKSDFLMGFDAGGRETTQGQQDVTIRKFIGEKDGHLLIEETITDIIAIQKTLDKVSADHDMNRLADIPYILYIDSTGYIDDISTEFLEFEDEIRVLKMGMDVENLLYPFGIGAKNVSIGDTWISDPDSVTMFAGDGGIENYMLLESEYTLKKVKLKKGRKIATIKTKTMMNCNLSMVQGGKLFEGDVNGIIKGKVLFDLDMGKMILIQSSGSLNWDFSMEDKSFSGAMDMTHKQRMINK